MSRARDSSKAAGEAIEAEILDLVPSLQNVSDRDAKWHDARVDGLFEPSERIIFGSTLLLEDGLPIEIKAAQRRLNSGQRGRFYIRQRQHERLLEESAAYLFAVYEPRDQTVIAMLAVPASIVDELLPDGWTSVDADRSEVGYRQLAWSRLLDPKNVEGSQ
ncbi:hypothetical protein [Halobacterium sp. CBA1126]|uniref:hypothetical protein n=1 Tax=Halobacterium sp. CBA1126 TaxID=2668074 RepID=UPI0012FB5939|nr:hypothetical protein [Halobacterium sp. CBA1126]MUV60003.1 hypothetical protein [Halobacterium sp. CBA1126]